MRVLRRAVIDEAVGRRCRCTARPTRRRARRASGSHFIGGSGRRRCRSCRPPRAPGCEQRDAHRGSRARRRRRARRMPSVPLPPSPPDCVDRVHESTSPLHAASTRRARATIPFMRPAITWYSPGAEARSQKHDERRHSSDGCREAGETLEHSPRYCDRGRRGTATCQPLGNWEGAAKDEPEVRTPLRRDLGVKATRRVRHPASRGVTNEPTRIARARARARVRRRRAARDVDRRDDHRHRSSARSRCEPAARDRDRALGDAPFVTIVHPDDHPATASVADALGATVGVQTRSLGGLGAYESISVRGAAPGHTAVLVDGVPLARIAAVTTDLGRFALDAFGEVELYRGAVPVELGGAGVGGALNLVTRLGRGEHGERVRASIGAGSFGARHAARCTTATHHGGACCRRRRSATRPRPATTRTSPTTARRSTRPTTRYRRARATTASIAARCRDARRHARSQRRRRRARRVEAPGPAGQRRRSRRSTRRMSTLDVIGDARGDARRRRGDGAPARLRARRAPAPARSDGELGLGTQDRALPDAVGRRVVDVARCRSARIARRRASSCAAIGSATPIATACARRCAAIARAVRCSRRVDLALDAATIVVTPAMRLDVVRTAPTPMTDGPDA